METKYNQYVGSGSWKLLFFCWFHVWVAAQVGKTRPTVPCPNKPLKDEPEEKGKDKRSAL